MFNNELVPEYSNSRALVIGINEYENVSPLRHAYNDAKAISDILLKKFNFDAANITRLYDQDATRENIISSYLAYTSTDVDCNERLVVFFAGHGWTMTGHGGEVGFLLPYDGKQDDLKSLIRWDDFTKNTDLIPSKHILFIMDACYGGLAITRSPSYADDRFVDNMLIRRGRQVLTAGKADETVADQGGPLAGHSVFTGHLIQALSGEAESEEGTITANGVISYVYRKVSTELKSQQTPHFGYLEGDGDLVFKARDLKLLSDSNHPLRILKRTSAREYYPFEEALVEQLLNKNVAMRSNAMAQIRGILESSYDDADDALHIIEDLLRFAIADEEEGVRNQALFLFSKFTLTGDKECTDALRRILRDDENEENRWLAASCLANMGSDASPAIEDLIHALDDENSFVQEDAALALYAIGNEAWNAIQNSENKKIAKLFEIIITDNGRRIDDLMSKSIE